MNEWEWQLLEDKANLEHVCISGVDLQRGSKVRLRPRQRADILDMALSGKTATIESIEQDYENTIHVAVTVDDDPGRDLGLMRQTGHRFFFLLNELEPCE